MNAKNITSTQLRQWVQGKKTIDVFGDRFTLDVFSSNITMVFDLIEERSNKKRGELLKYVYKITGNTLASGTTEEKQKLQMLISSGSQQQNIFMQNWANRTMVVFKNMKKYDYREWCEGVFSERDIPLG